MLSKIVKKYPYFAKFGRMEIASGLRGRSMLSHDEEVWQPLPAPWQARLAANGWIWPGWPELAMVGTC